MRALFLGLLITLAAPVAAQNAGKVAGGAAMTPLEDTNIKKREIPPVLLTAADDPYTSQGTRNCAQLSTAIGDLDGVLGPDFDAATQAKKGLTSGMIAKGVVASFIPFRGVVREVSGAAGAERRYQAAVDAGIARRGYLRGVARMKGCKPANATTVATN